MTTSTLPTFAAPLVSPDSKPFWEATARGEFLIKRCGACGEAHFYPRPICPFCGSDDTHWEAASGRGAIYTYTVVRKWEVPAAIAFVELEEGPRMLTLIVDADLDKLQIGQRVKACFAAAEEDYSVVLFKPEDQPQ